jgi:hypothetical protein
MPAEARTAFERRARWRARSAAVLRKRGVHPDFLAASGFAPRHAPEAARRLSIERAGSLDPVLWVPGPDQLPRWDVDHIDTWAAGSEDALFTLGLAMEPQMVLTQAELQPDEFYALPPEAN